MGARINWALRLRNKATLVSLLTLTVTFVYTVLGVFGVVPPVAEGEVTQLLALAVQVLCALGIVTDPTTKGVGDSEAAMDRDAPV